MHYSVITPDQVRELQSWDADSRMAFDELAARLEFKQGLSREAAELQSFTSAAKLALRESQSPVVNHTALPPKLPRHGKETQAAAGGTGMDSTAPRGSFRFHRSMLRNSDDYVRVGFCVVA